MRAIAVLMVIAFHAGLPVPGGFVGVDVFFVISGFVITDMLRREWKAHGRIRFGQFYLRRFKRLIPALATTVFVTLLLATIFLSPLGTQETAAQTGLGALGFAANIVIARTTGGYFDAPADSNALLNTWSLSVEEQFYFVFPVVLACGWVITRRSRIKRAPVWLVGLLGVISFAAAWWGIAGNPLDIPPRLVYLSTLVFGFYSPMTRAWEFAAGALLALVAAHFASSRRRMAVIASMIGLSLLALSLWAINDRTPFPGPWAVLPVVGTLLLLASRTASPHPIQRGLSAPWLVRTGDWSYSLYLWHWPFIVFARTQFPGSSSTLLVAAVLAVVPALASFYWIEQPIRSKVLGTRRSVVKLIVATLLPPLMAAAALTVAAKNGFWLPQVKMYQAAIGPDHAGQRAGCTASLPWQVVDACTWGKDEPGAPVYLVGDSQADHFSEGLILATDDLNRPLANFGVDGCAFANSNVIGSLCQRVYEGTQQFLLSANPGLVIISNATADDTLEATTRALQSAGHKVLVVQAVPLFAEWRPDACTLPTILQSRCSRSMSITTAETHHGHDRDVIARIGRSTGASVVDTWPLMCPNGVCSTELDGLIRYRDTDHITVVLSERLAPFWRSAIMRASDSADRK